MMKLPKTLSSSSLKCEDLKIHKDLKKENLPTSFNSSEQMMRRNFSDVATEEKVPKKDKVGKKDMMVPKKNARRVIDQSTC